MTAPPFDVAFCDTCIGGSTVAAHLARPGLRAFYLAEAGVAPEDLDEVILAGAFGYHLRPESLATIGLIPGRLARKVRFAGNTAKTGAAMLLLNKSSRAYIEKTVLKIEHLALAERESFQDMFIENLNFPAGD